MFKSLEIDFLDLKSFFNDEINFKKLERPDKKCSTSDFAKDQYSNSNMFHLSEQSVSLLIVR